MSGERASIVRPSIPPVAWTAIGSWIGLSVAEALSWRAYQGSAAFTIGGPVCAALGLAGLAWWRRRSGALPMLAVGLAAGLCVGSIFWADWHRDVSTIPLMSRRWIAEATEDPREGRYGAVSDVRVDGARGLNWSCTWQRASIPPEAGDSVEFYGSAKAPGRDEWGRLQHQQGITGRLTARHQVSRGPARSLRGVMSPWRRRAADAIGRVEGPGGDLVAGVVLGDRRRLAGTEAESDFRITGLSHLIAVSGGHLVVVAALTTWAMVKIGVRKRLVLVVVCMLLGAYVVLSGVQASALRAWVMACVAGLAGVAQRRRDGLAALSIAVCVILLGWPPAAFELGMKLSASAVAGLLLFGRLAEGWVAAAMPRRLAGLAGAVALTLTAQAATLPMTASTFGMVSLVSPLANLMAAPCISSSLTLGLTGIVFSAVSETAGHAVLRLAGLTGGVAAWIASALSSWPYAAVPLGLSAIPAAAVFVSAGAILWSIWPAPRPRTARLVTAIGIVASAWVFAAPLPVSGPELVVMDVGQGDAILVREGVSAVLVDTGPSASALRAALLRQRVRRLDAVVLTHLHEDHTGGLEALEKVISVGRVVVPSGALSRHSDILEMTRRVTGTVDEVSAGDVLRIGDTRVRVVWPLEDVEDATANEASVVVVVEGSGFSALLTGDAEHGEIEAIIASGFVGDVDVFKVGHHGSAASVSDGLLRVLRPEYALVSVGSGNRFGHPVPSTVTALTRSGTRVLRTDIGGDLRVRWDRSGYKVEQSRDGGRLDACAKLMTVSRSTGTKGSPGFAESRSQARISHPQRAGAAGRAGSLQTQGSHRRERRPGLQHAGLFGRERPDGRGNRRLQHHAVRLRSPPRDRAFG